MSQINSNEKFEIFISYQWNMKKTVKQFCDKLNESIENLNIWRDDDQLRSDSSSLSVQLTKGIRNSKLIVCFITKEYRYKKLKKLGEGAEGVDFKVEDLKATNDQEKL